MSFDLLRNGGHQPGVAYPAWQVDLDELARQKAERDETARVALKKLAHYADGAEDYRLLADALGLDLGLLRKAAG